MNETTTMTGAETMQDGKEFKILTHAGRSRSVEIKRTPKGGIFGGWAGPRGAYYGLIPYSNHDGSLFFVMSTTSRSAKAPKHLDGVAFVIDGDTIREATYEEVKASRVG